LYGTGSIKGTLDPLREGHMSKFIVFIYDDESRLASLSGEEVRATTDAHGAFAQRNGPALRGGGRLAPSGEAVSIVAGNEGEANKSPLLPDAPLAITGYYIIEADDAAAATEIAKQVPSLPGGGVEVRQLVG
jgi:hypothetical protein